MSVSQNALPSPEEVFDALVSHVSRKEWAEAAELYSSDAVVEHPNSVPGSPVPQRLAGRDEIRNHFAVIGQTGFDVQARSVQIHRTEDPEVVVCEFEYYGTSGDDPDPFTMTNIFVMRVRDGFIVESRDYQGPLRRRGDQTSTGNPT